MDNLFVEAFFLQARELTMNSPLSDSLKERIVQKQQKRIDEQAQQNRELIEQRLAAAEDIAAETKEIFRDLMQQAMQSEQRTVVFMTTDQQN